MFLLIGDIKHIVAELLVGRDGDVMEEFLVMRRVRDRLGIIRCMYKIVVILIPEKRFHELHNM